MSRTLLYLSVILITGFYSCSSEKEIAGEEKIPAGGKIYFFYYDSAGSSNELKAHPVPMRDEAGTAEALEIILDQLSNEFSKGDFTRPKSEIKFELKGIEYIETNIRKYPVAFINISDPANIMEKVYFQGSTGGMHTQNTVLVNLLQPQITGFMDACIIYINNIPVGEKDHVNFQGILPATDVMKYFAERAIKQQ